MSTIRSSRSLETLAQASEEGRILLIDLSKQIASALDLNQPSVYKMLWALFRQRCFTVEPSEHPFNPTLISPATERGGWDNAFHPQHPARPPPGQPQPAVRPSRPQRSRRPLSRRARSHPPGDRHRLVLPSPNGQRIERVKSLICNGVLCVFGCFSRNASNDIRNQSSTYHHEVDVGTPSRRRCKSALYRFGRTCVSDWRLIALRSDHLLVC